VFQTSEILTRLSWLVDEATRWGPALPVALVFVVALVEAVVLPRRLWAKGVAVLVVVLSGVAAGGLLRWDERTTQGTTADRLTAETSALRDIWNRWDALSHTMPPAGDETPGKSEGKFDTVDDALASLRDKVTTVADQIAALRAGLVGRSIDPATALKLAEALRAYGSYRVVVSCVPGDMEAYAYANQFVGILRAAGWDANGPEATVNVVDQPAIGVTVLIRDPTAPDAAKVLLDALNQFNIPHQPGIAADTAIPDTATVELYVAKKP
jgi:hypothetical protein